MMIARNDDIDIEPQKSHLGNAKNQFSPRNWIGRKINILTLCRNAASDSVHLRHATNGLAQQYLFVTVSSIILILKMRG
jgi:hypothetical protein